MTPPAGAAPVAAAAPPVAPPPPMVAAPPIIAQPILAPPGMLAPLPLVDRPYTQARPTDSYRAQTLLADVAVVGVFLLASKNDSGNAAWLGVAGYALAAPIIHLAHHHGSRAAASLLLSAGLPILGGVIGNKLAQSSSSTCYDGYDYCDGNADGQIAATAFGVLIGGVTASIIDTAYLARGEDAPTPSRFAPAISARPGGMTLGVGMSF
jgi:hypothetical protein